jgi:hypothetical protein
VILQLSSVPSFASTELVTFLTSTICVGLLSHHNNSAFSSITVITSSKKDDGYPSQSLRLAASIACNIHRLLHSHLAYSDVSVAVIFKLRTTSIDLLTRPLHQLTPGEWQSHSSIVCEANTDIQELTTTWKRLYIFKMASDLETVELDQIPLPPIPGPLPPTFFTDIPPGSAAIFSTLLGTRPFRSLSNPVPVHAIRSGSENDIRDRSCDLFKRYLTIAESIVTPPTTWQDLYHYFDATDLWTEGAGFLFHVLGYIVRVNVTKLNFLESFASEWAFSNEVRLANMVPCQDILSSLQTPDDQAWFDYNNLTSHDKEILNSILKRHCEAFQVKRISPPAVALNGPVQATVEAQRILSTVSLGGPVQVTVEAQRVRSAINSSEPIQMVVEAQRIPYNMSADPYQHFGRPGNLSVYYVSSTADR